ncbi:MAG: Sec-independent protein translocase TatA [Bacteroidetes bacterium CG2_30_33_31]|nr:MAG: Sec-independent protein translocase TatA [Bacteroidetes bacterium CG2_30_33_31]
MIDSILIGMVGGSEIIIILAVVLLLFGGKKIPELMRGLGKGVKEFKDATNGLQDELKEVKDEMKKIDPTNDLRK